MEIHSFIYWNADPDLVRFGPITIRWYGLFFATAFFSGFYMVQRMFKSENKEDKDLDTLLFYIMSGTIIGARLGHTLFYDPIYYLGHPLEILSVWKGGLASHGGAAGIIISLYLFSRRRNEYPFIFLLDRIAIPSLFGGALVRIGNFFNSEIIGMPSKVPWAIVFERIDTMPRHPAQLYEAAAYLLLFSTAIYLYRSGSVKRMPGLMTGFYFASVFSARFFIEFVKTRQAAYGIDLPLSVGQMLSIPFIAAGITLLVVSLKRGYREGGKPALCDNPSLMNEKA